MPIVDGCCWLIHWHPTMSWFVMVTVVLYYLWLLYYPQWLALLETNLVAWKTHHLWMVYPLKLLILNFEVSRKSDFPVEEYIMVDDDQPSAVEVQLCSLWMVSTVESLTCCRVMVTSIINPRSLTTKHHHPFLIATNTHALWTFCNHPQPPTSSTILNHLLNH